jgi:hypothetical protein
VDANSIKPEGNMTINDQPLKVPTSKSQDLRDTGQNIVSVDELENTDCSVKSVFIDRLRLQLAFSMSCFETRSLISRLIDYYLDATNPKTSSGRLVYAYIRQQLKCFNLADCYSENYILNEVYFRFLDRMLTIREIRPWIKGTARLVIRELSRKEGKFVYWDDESLYEQPQEEEEDWQEHFEAVRKALQQLSQIDARLLELKIVEKKSWTIIREVMRVEGHGNESEATWRKRKERALLKLRKIYHQIMPPF